MINQKVDTNQIESNQIESDKNIEVCCRTGEKITIISSQKNWLEQNAINQLNQISRLPGVTKVVGLPDLHPGKTPVGVTIITKDVIYPYLIGNDIGCGMSLFLTGMEKRKIKIDKIIKKSENIKDIREISLPDGFNEDSPLGKSLGTIGGGNHFAEIQETFEVFCEEEYEKLGFKKDFVTLLVHSGSRGYGQLVLDESIRVYKSQNGLLAGSDGCVEYLEKHDQGVKWASINRDIVSYRILKAFGLNFAQKLIECCHNSISVNKMEGKSIYVHRKGTTPSDNGPVIIPGSRGALTYLVMPVHGCFDSGYSLAHGAGRKWERSMCRSRLKDKYTKDSIKSTKIKSRVICNDTNLLFEEAPEAYKNIDTVIESLLDFGLIKIIATFRPVITYKN